MSEDKIQVLMADDDSDDRELFADALKACSYDTELTAVNNGIMLMRYLTDHLSKLPDVLFLDLNMPLQNGFECLDEIRNNNDLKHLRVVIFSTIGPGQMVDKLYQKGAYYFIQKPFQFKRLTDVVQHALSKIAENRFVQPAREDFILM